METSIMDELDKYVFCISEGAAVKIDSMNVVNKGTFNSLFSRYKLFKNKKPINDYLTYFLSNDMMKCVEYMTYDPEQPRIFTNSDGHQCLNTFRGVKTLESVAASEDVDDVINKWMVSITADDIDSNKAQFIKKHIAKIIQNPTQKGEYALLVQGSQGTGKTMIHEFISRIIGSENTSKIQSSSFHSQYNDWQTGHILATIDEIKEQGSSRLNAYNAIKECLTSDIVTVNQKYRSPVQKKTCRHFILCTNYKDALRADEDDRRFAIIYEKDRSKDDTFVKDQLGNKSRYDFFYYDFVPLLDAYPAQFKYYFENVDVSDYYQLANQVREEGKSQLNDSSKPAYVEEIEDYFESDDYPFPTSEAAIPELISEYINDNKYNVDIVPKHKIISYLREHQYEKFTVRSTLDRKTHRVWAKRYLDNGTVRELFDKKRAPAQFKNRGNFNVIK